MLGSGGKSLKEVPLTNQHHHQHRKKEITRDIPRGYIPIKVGQGEEQQKIVVPVMYLNHPLFSQLLKEAEEEYGFDQQGTIIIPCHEEQYRYVRDLIDKEKCPQHRHQGCFRASSQQVHM